MDGMSVCTMKLGDDLFCGYDSICLGVICNGGGSSGGSSSGGGSGVMEVD